MAWLLTVGAVTGAAAAELLHLSPPPIRTLSFARPSLMVLIIAIVGLAVANALLEEIL
jgi:hypothetical protein